MRRETGRLGAVIAALVLAGCFAVAVETSPGDESAVSRSSRPDVMIEPRPAPLRGAAPSPSSVVRAAHRGEPVVAELRTHDSCASLLHELQARALPLVTAYGLPTYGGVPMPAGTAVAESSASGGATAGGSGSTVPAFSTTNVQETGVDEPDVVKNDAERIFTLFEGTLRSLAVDDGRPIARDALALTGVHDLLLVGDRIVAVGNDTSVAGQRARFVTVDVSDPSDLRVVAETTAEGSYVSARAVGDSIRVVTSQGGPVLPFVYPASAEGEDEALAQNRRAVLESEVGDWLPEASACDDVYTPRRFAGLGSTTVLTVDPRTGTVVDAATIVADAGEVYATPSHLYVASWPWVPTMDGATAPEATHIHRFDIRDASRTVYEASGVVPGHLLRPFAWGGGGMGQWSLSEHGDVLRVATTIGESWGNAPASQSSITTLRVEGRALVHVGTVTGLGVGEQIYAVRFMGDLGYVVTYRRTDPLYVVDLADPTAPRVLGELKVPGYSAYLHPVGDGRLLGIGQDDPDEDGVVDGTQVSLFDISDPASPRRLSQLSFGPRGTSSAVEHDHRAFTWWADPARAILPLTSWDGTSDSFTGAVAVGVKGDRLVEVGRLSHVHPNDERCVVPIERSRVIGDALLTFSPAGVAVHAIQDLHRRSETAYDDVQTGWCPEQVEEPPPTTTTSTTTLIPVGPERD